MYFLWKIIPKMGGRGPWRCTIFHDLFHTSTSGCILIDFWHPLGPVWLHLCLVLATVYLPLAAFWLTFGALWLTFGALGSLLAILALDFLAFGAP